MTDQPRDWHMLPWFQDERNMQKFKEADIIYGDDSTTGRLVRVYRGEVLLRIVGDERITHIREVKVPISRERGELDMLRAACKQLRGRDDYNPADEEGRLS